MAETFSCCGHHDICQATGKCVYENKTVDYLDYQDCQLYQNIIKHKFEVLYKLKNMGLVDIQNNHLTEKGIEIMKQKAKDYDKMYMLLNIIYITGLRDNSRLSPVVIKNNLIKAINELKL